MSVFGLPCWISAVLLFQLWGSYIVSSNPVCPDTCLCEKTFLNCTALGLSRVPSQIPATITALDLSHNALGSLAPFGSSHVQLQMLQHLWVRNNSLQNLSLCLGKGRMGTRTLLSKKEWCVSWAPNLQLLSAEWNQLRNLPKGLESVKSLQVLQLSHNKISELGPTDLAGCTNISKLYLQHNLINIIHPEAFKNQQNLQVLDLSHNLLTTVPMPAYLSLRNMNTLVDISGNRWRCDCYLSKLRRWLSFDHDMGNTKWNVICSSPFHHAGKVLIHLQESDLTCPQPLYSTSSISKDLTVNEGVDLLLSCSSADQDLIQSRWWTPQGQITDSQQFLLLRNVSKQHVGLYVCVSGFQEEHVSVFNLHVHHRVDLRMRRDVFNELIEEENRNMQRNVPAVRQVTQPQFALAVSLSVIITFIVAFVLGVLLRPLLDKCCIKIKNKKDSTLSSTSRTSSSEPRPYVNEGYSDTNDQEVQAGSRVRFGEVTEITIEGVQNYVTVEDPSSGSLSNGNMEIEVQREVPLKKENKKILDTRYTSEFPNAKTHKDVDIKNIKDSENTAEEEEKSTSSASSCSDEHHELSSHEVKECIEQSVDSSSISTHEDDESSSNQILEFTTDPFLGIPKYKEQSVDELDQDLWNDSGESFSFNDGSTRSSGRVSQLSGQDDFLMSKENNVVKQSGEQYSSNSSESGESEFTSAPSVKRPNSSQVHELIPKENFFGDIGSYIDFLPKVKRYLQFTPSDKITTSVHHNFFQKIGVSFDGLPKITRYIQFAMEIEDGSLKYIVNPEDEKTKTNYDIYYNKINRSYVDEDVEEQHTGTRQYSCSSSESGESEGGFREYTVNPENDESETNSDIYHRENKSDVVIGMDPFFRQDTITLDPSDIHMTFTRGDSFDDDFLTDFRKFPVPSEFANNYEDEPKQYQVHPVYRTTPNTSSFLQSDISETEKSSSSGDEQDDDYPRRLEMKTEHEAKKTYDAAIPLKNPKVININHDNYSSSTDIEEKSSKEIKSGIFNRFSAKIFNKNGSETNKPVQPSTKRANTDTKGLMASLGLYLKQQPETKTEDVKPNTDEDYFLLTVPESYDELPKLKRYLWFSVCEPPVTETIPNSMVNSSIKDIIFGNFDGPVPRVKQYLHFSKTESTQASSAKKDLFHKVKKESECGGVSEPVKRDDFFSEIDATFHTLPKVKKYLQFLPSEIHLSSFSPFPSSMKKMEIPKYESRPSTDSTKFKVFFKESSVSLDSPPKVQRYIYFTQPQISAQSLSTPTKATMMIPELTTLPPVKESDSSVVQELPDNAEDFFRDIGSSVDNLPKVKRHIQIIPSDIPTQTKQIGREVKTNESSVNYKPVNKANFFQKIGVSFAGLPKITRYIQFTRPVPQLPPKRLHRPVVKPDYNDNFFESIKASFCEVPKVKRYILFSKSLNIHEVKSEIRDMTELSRPGLSVVVIKPSPENNFFEQIGTSFYSLPKVNKYIQFNQSNPNVLLQAQQSLSDSTQWVTETKKSSKSPKKEMPATRKDNFFEMVGLSMTSMPKLKRYLKFTLAQVYAQPPYFKTEITTEFVTPNESTPDSSPQEISKGETFFRQIDSSVYEVPKIKRYIQFIKSEKQPLSNAPSKSAPKTDHKISDLSSIDVTGTCTEEFIWQRASSFHAVPKVRRYIQFSQSDVQPLTQPSSDSTQWVTESRDLRESHKEEAKTTTKADNFFENVGTSVKNIQKVKRYILVKEIQFPLKTEITPETQTTLNARPGSFSKENPSQILMEDISFGQKDTFNVPKVKRYIHFTKSERKPLVQSPTTYLDREWVTAELARKTKAQRKYTFSEDGISTSTLGKNDLWQFEIPLNEVPKVKRYIKFSEMYSPTHQVSVSIPKHKEPEDDKGIGPSMNRQIDSSLGVPGVKRFIQFTRSEPQSLVQAFSTPSVFVTPKLPTHIQSERSEKLGATAEREHLFGDIGTCEISKVKKYIKFTKLEPFNQPYDPLVPVRKPELEINSDSWRSNSSVTKSNENIFFDKVHFTVHNIPKVKRYIWFTISETHPSVPPKSGSVTATTMECWKPRLIKSYVNPTMTEDDFFRQIGQFFSSLPKVKRYIHFSQFNPSPSSQSQSKYSSKQTAMNKDNVIEGLSVSFDNIPKVRKSLQFSQTVPQPSNQIASPSLTTKKVIPQLMMKTELESPKECNENNEYNLFRQSDSLLNGVPKVNKYIKFSQSDVQSSTQSSSVNLKEDILTKSEKYNSQAMDDIPIFRTHNIFVSGSSSINSIPRPLGYDKYSGDTDRSIPPNLKTSKEISEVVSDFRPVPKPRKNLSLTLDTAPKDKYQSVFDSSLTSPGPDDFKEYLKDSSLARQRQERRKLMFQQKRRAMDGFSLSPQSLPSPEDDQQSVSTVPTSSKHSVPTVNANYRGVDLSKYETHSAKLSPLRTKSTMHHGTVKHSDV